MLTVHADPRLEVSIEDLKARDAVYEQYYSLVGKSKEGFDQLLDARKTISLVNSALVNAPDSTKKQISKAGKDLTKKLNELEKLYMEPEGLKGIQGNDEDLMSRISSVRRYLRSLEGPATQAVQLLMDQAKDSLSEVLEKVNGFMQGDFADYQKKVEAVKISLFKEMEPVKME